MPQDVAESSEGVVLIADGIGPMLRWDGFAQQAEEAGLRAPTTAPSIAGSGSGTLTGTYFAYVRFLDKDFNVSNLSPISAQASITNKGQIDYTNIPVPTEARVVRKQILRNTTGQAATFYVDVDTDQISTTSFTSALTDAVLSNNEAVPILDSNGAIFANLNDPPPSDKPFIASHITRMWGFGESPYAEGSVAVTKGSTTVTGAATEWTPQMAGRFLYIDGATKPYEIDSVDSVNQTLVLLTAYADDTNPYAAYSIKPPPANSSVINYTPAGKPESWPPTFGLSLPEDSDVITGGMTYQSFLYILKRRHIYRITAQADPAQDGFVFLSLNRGCVNHRCWVIAEESAYLLDEQGAYRFTGGNSAQPISTPIQDIFRRQGQGINWQASRYFHASWSPTEEVIRWFVAINSDYLPRHALCYSYNLGRWCVEKFPVPIGSSCLGRAGRVTGGWSDAGPQVYYGGMNGEVYVANAETLDLVSPTSATTYGSVSSATDDTLTDLRATFDTSWENVPVVITEGRGVGQMRIVVSATGSQLRVNECWAIKPDTTSKYQVGGISYRYVSGRMRYEPTEIKGGRSVEIMCEPTRESIKSRISIINDFSHTGVKMGLELGKGLIVGQKTSLGGSTRDLDLSKPNGVHWWKYDGGRELSVDSPRLFRLGMEGVSGPSRVIIGEVLINGAVR